MKTWFQNWKRPFNFEFREMTYRRCAQCRLHRPGWLPRTLWRRRSKSWIIWFVDRQKYGCIDSFKNKINATSYENRKLVSNTYVLSAAHQSGGHLLHELLGTEALGLLGAAFGGLGLAAASLFLNHSAKMLSAWNEFKIMKTLKRSLDVWLLEFQNL